MSRLCQLREDSLASVSMKKDFPCLSDSKSVQTNFTKADWDSLVGSMLAWCAGGQRFESREGRELLILTKKELLIQIQIENSKMYVFEMLYISFQLFSCPLGIKL